MAGPFQVHRLPFLKPAVVGGGITGTLAATDPTDSLAGQAGVQGGAGKNFYLLNTTGASPNFMGAIQDGGSAPTAVVSTFGWTVAKTSTSTPYWQARIGATAAATVASASSTIATDTHPTAGTGTGNTTAGDSFRTQNAYTGAFVGTFAPGNWVFNFGMRCTTSSSQAGHINCRLWASTDASGQTGTRELTSGSLVGSTVTLSSTTATFTSTVTWAAPQITLNNGEYLFLQVEWVETVASGSNSGDVKFYISADTITTPVFNTYVSGAAASTDIIDTASMSGTVASVITGPLASTDPVDVSTQSGTVAWPAITGTLAATEATDAAAITGGSGLAFAVLAATDAPDTASTPSIPAPTSLLHFDTSSTADAISPHAWTLIGSSTNTYVDPSQSKFGGASLYLDGSASAGILSDCTQDYAFGTGDYTVDFWARPIQNTLVYLISWQAVGDSTENLDIGFYDQGDWYFYTAQNATHHFAPVTYGVWQHIAICRQGGLVYCFKDGILDPNHSGVPFTDTFNVYVSSTTAPLIGQSRVNQGSAFLGNIEEVRFIKGYAAWTSNFTPPTAPYSATGVTGLQGFQGQVAWTGALAATDQRDTASLQGQLGLIGGLAATELPDISAIAGSTGWSGTLAATDQRDISAIAGLAAASGSLAATDATDAAAIAGTVAWTGVLATTDPQDHAALAGLAAAFGPFTATDTLDTAALAGTAAWNVALSATDPTDQAAVAGYLAALAQLAATETPDTAALTGAVMISLTATLTASDPPDVSAVAGQVTGIAGTMAATEAADTAVVAGSVQWLMALAATDNRDTAAVAGTVAWRVTLAATDTADAASFPGAVSWLATLSSVDAADHAALAGTVFSVVSGTLAATDPVDAAALAGTVFSGVSGVLAATDPHDLVPAASEMLESYTPGNTRGGAFWVGAFVTPNTNQTVTQIGCLAGNGNSGTTTVTLVDQATGTILADTTVNMSAPQANGFCYGPITPTILTGGHAYVVAANSAPMAGWADVNGSFATYGPDFTSTGGAYNSSEGGPYTAAGGWPYWQYVGVDLIYGTPGFAGTVTGIAGTLAATEFTDSFSSAGQVINPAIAVLAATDPHDVAALAGGLSWQITLTATDQPDHAAFAGQVISYLALAATDTPDAAVLAGEVVTFIALAATDDTDIALITGAVHAQGQIPAVPGDVPPANDDRLTSETPDRIVWAGALDRTVVVNGTPPPDRSAAARVNKRTIVVAPLKRVA